MPTPVHTPIKAWAEDERPREKMLQYGPTVLSNSELLAIIINNGSGAKSAVDLAREVLQLAENQLLQLQKLGIKDLEKIKGIGRAKAIAIKAALELARRQQSEVFAENPCLLTSRDVAEYVKVKFPNLTQEHFIAIYLNAKRKPLGFDIVSSGGMTSTIVDIRIILRRALEEKATSIILSHNHPSGESQPSTQDIYITKKLQQAASLMDISVNDHVIIGETKHYSFADEGML